MRIAFFGNFGAQNIGNECTLQAILHNIRERLPEAELHSICSNPADTAVRHRLKAVSISAVTASPDSGAESVSRRSVPARLLRTLLVRVPRELYEWPRALNALKGTDILVMTGTGMLTDLQSASAFGWPYEIFKWTCAARLRGCRVRFTAVGVGPIHRRLAKRFILVALSLADYRSYRDHASKARLQTLGFDRREDRVIPDLAFSLPASILRQAGHMTEHRAPVVGVGVMDYFGAADSPADRETAHRAYLEKMCEFIQWLIKQDYTVRILHGDVAYDAAVRKRLRAMLASRGLPVTGRIIDEDVASVTELVSHIADTDVVVSPRYHNLVLALMLQKPVIAISYDVKSDALLEGVGLGMYCQPIEHLRIDRLIEQFTNLRIEFRRLECNLRARVDEYRRIWQVEYARVLRIDCQVPPGRQTGGLVPTSAD